MQKDMNGINPRIFDLPQDIRKLAIANQKAHSNESNDKQRIMHAFDFENTPEGADAWRLVCNAQYEDFRKMIKPTKLEAKKIVDKMFAQLDKSPLNIQSNSPINNLIDSSVKCTNCGSLGVGSCDCWTKCIDCNWSYGKGDSCGNPDCPSNM